MNKLSHIDAGGKAVMVDISDKKESAREASASVEVHLNDAALQALRDNSAAKGDVLAVARLAGIQAGKRTWELIPLCHQIPLNQIAVEFEIEPELKRILILSRVKTSARTGAEMEALTSCAAAAGAASRPVPAGRWRRGTSRTSKSARRSPRTSPERSPTWRN